MNVKPPTNTQFERLVHQIDPHSQLLRTWQLTGGVSAQVTALEIVRADGQHQKLVVRQHGEADLRSNPNIAADEFRLLGVLKTAGISVPTPYFVDPVGEFFSTPCIVVDYVEGETEFSPSNIDDYTRQCAEQLVHIHLIEEEICFLPSFAQRCEAVLNHPLTQLNEDLYEGRIRASLSDAFPLTHSNVPVLLHGDYWMGNLLWRDGQLAAVIDWEDAAVGDPLADVGNARLELLWAVGVEAMQAFTKHYYERTTIDFTDLPYWDLYAALRPIGRISEFATDESVEQRMREQHRWFTAQALERLRA